MENLLFGVEKVETASIMQGDRKTTSAISHAIVGKGKVLHFCSEGYGLVPNNQIYQNFVNYFNKHGMKFTASGTNFNDTRFQMDFAMVDHPIEIDKGDLIYPSIRILNSYNGYQRYSFAIRVLRQICTNGLTALVEEKAINMLHTPQVVDGVAVDLSVGLLGEFLEIYEDAAEPFHELRDFPVRDIPMRIAEVAEAIEFPVGLAQYAVERAIMEMKTHKLPPTDWLVYNALNFQLNHNADNLVGRKASKLDKDALEYLLAY